MVVTEGDIAKILQAKAAIYAGLKTLLGVSDCHGASVDRFILAGGFSRHIDLDNARMMGLIPDIPDEKIEVIGNGSLAGSFLALIEPNALKSYHEIATQPEVVELNLVPAFQNNFIEALMLPHLDEDEFPSLIGILA